MKSFFVRNFGTLAPQWRHVLFQGTFVPLTSGIEAGPDLLVRAISDASLAGFLQTVFYIAISVGAILAVLRIAYAGFVYMTTDAVGLKGDAKKMIQEAVLGLLLLLAIVIILGRINPNLLRMNFDLDNGGTTAPATTASPFPTAGTQ